MRITQNRNPKLQKSFTDLYNAIIEAEERIGSTNQEILKLEDRFVIYKNFIEVREN